MEGSPARGSKSDDANSGGRMTGFRYWATILGGCFAAVFFGGCGGASNPNAIAIALTTPGGILMVDQSNPTAMPPILPTLTFTASVANDTENAGVCWDNMGTGTCKGIGTSLTGSPACGKEGTGSGDCGMLSNETPFSVTYTPPSNINAQQTITLTATSIANPTVKKTATITVVVAPAFVITNCNPPNVSPCVLPNGSNGVPYTQAISFTGGVSPYTFMNTALPPCLHLTTSSTTTTGTVSGTPCNTATSTTTFLVTVTDSGGAPPVAQPYTISLSAAPLLSVSTASLPPGFFDAQYNSSVVTTGGVAPLTYTFTPTPAASLPAGQIAGLPPGLSANTSTGQITGVPTQQAIAYPATYSFTVQVTDSALPTPQVQPVPPLQLSITIQAPPPLQITTLSLPAGSTATGYSGSLQAKGGVPPYTWSVVQGQLPSGLTLSSESNGTGTISGTPILVNTSTFTVQVADSQVNPVTGKPNPTMKTQSFSISVTNGANNNDSLLKGTYSFLFNGFDKDGTVAIAGAFTADGNGNITAGNEDANRVSGVATTLSLTGTYTIDPSGDGGGTIELIATAGQSTLTTDYQLVLESEGNFSMFEDNSTKTNTDVLHTYGEGVVKLVQGSSFGAVNLSGNYAFEFSGPDLAAKRAALAGKIYADGVGTLTRGSSDFNYAGALTTQSIAGGFEFLSGNRGILENVTFQVPNQPQESLNFVFYFVSPSDLFVLEVDNNTSTGQPTEFRMSGEMVLQNPSTTFGNATLAGTSVTTGTALNGANADVVAGILTSTACDGSTPVTLAYDENNASTVTSSSFSGTCTINSNGRAVFTGLGSSPADAHLAVAYLTGPGSGFLLGGDTGVTTGLLEQQTGGPPYLAASIMGGYTLSAPFLVDPQSTNLLGQLTANGIGGISGTIDEIDPPATSAPNLAQAFAGIITGLGANGRGVLTTTAPVPVGFPTGMVLYIVSPASVRLLPTDTTNQHPLLIFLDH
jgi:Putative Ig domain